MRDCAMAVLCVTGPGGRAAPDAARQLSLLLNNSLNTRLRLAVVERCLASAPVPPVPPPHHPTSPPVPPPHWQQSPAARPRPPTRTRPRWPGSRCPAGWRSADCDPAPVWTVWAGTTDSFSPGRSPRCNRMYSKWRSEMLIDWFPPRARRDGNGRCLARYPSY